jgi:hypothetical protein
MGLEVWAKGPLAVQDDGDALDAFVYPAGVVQWEDPVAQSDLMGEGRQGLGAAASENGPVTAPHCFAGDQGSSVAVGSVDQKAWHCSTIAKSATINLGKQGIWQTLFL